MPETLQRETGISFVCVTHGRSRAFPMADRAVIMRRGATGQIGRPPEIYRTPGTRFVAEFMGSSNVFQEKLVQGDGGRAALDTLLGRFETGASQDSRPGNQGPERP
ncbi:hypothetical protein [Tabrizicola flagellatus]|uniref:hypothetical protein n=1 Tax=Tabrizicola flagellatus TaxID=2593021 RepID=UPI00338F9B2B